MKDGAWYGAVTDVDPAGRTIRVEAACRRAPGGGWVEDAAHATVPLAARARLTIYYRPNGDAAAGHSQPVGLRLFAQVAQHGRAPNFHPGWVVTVERGQAVAVDEDSGLLALRTPACDSSSP